MGTFHKVLAVLAIGSFAAILIMVAIGNHLQSRGVQNTGAISTTFKLAAFGLFLILGFSLVPLMVHVFVIAQGKIGNGNAGAITFLRTHEIGVAVAFWSVFTLGLLIALPVMWTQLFGFNTPAEGAQGVIVSNIGLTLSETASRSSYRIASGAGISINQGVFDFELADVGVRFTRCTYCALEADSSGKIVHIKVDISSRSLPPDQLKLERDAIVSQLRTAKLAAGYVDAADLEAARRKKSEGRDTQFWASNSALLILSDKQIDEEKSSVDPLTAGLYIHYIDVVRRDDPSYKTLVFDSTPSVSKTNIAN